MTSAHRGSNSYTRPRHSFPEVLGTCLSIYLAASSLRKARQNQLQSSEFPLQGQKAICKASEANVTTLASDALGMAVYMELHLQARKANLSLPSRRFDQPVEQQQTVGAFKIGDTSKAPPPPPPPGNPEVPPPPPPSRKPSSSHPQARYVALLFKPSDLQDSAQKLVKPCE